MTNSLQQNPYILLLVCFSVCISSFAQRTTLKGTVTDSLQKPLLYANILAFPDNDDEETAFAITDEKGNYILHLQKNVPYQLQISYLGFKKYTTAITLTQNANKNFVLQEDVSSLDGVEVTYKIPIQVKGDTTVYDTDAFTNGKERKLREVLKKLPGVEVDRAGNVTAKGNKITKVLVDNKPFFTGNSKMAVNNIPADVVDQIEVLENYSEVAMLKGLQDTEATALNIKLKKDRKKFIFGDIEVGGGHQNRYSLHPNVFYYSPKTNVNFIGDANNTGVKAFTLSDYLEFEGGFGKLLSNSGSYFSLFRDDFAQFLNNNNFKESVQKFGALNIRQAINSVTDISGYVIASDSDTDTETVTENLYQNNNNPFTENRSNTSNTGNFFTLGKITLDYDPSYKEDFAYNSFVKLTKNKGNGLISTQRNNNNTNILTKNNIDAFNLKQNISYSKKLTEKHTGTLEATYSYRQDSPDTEWNTDTQILAGLIPLVNDDDYTILQTKSAKTHTFSAIAKDYWTINNYNHLYFSLGTNYTFNNFTNKDVQQLNDGSINDFSLDGFGNDIAYNFLDTYLGLEYKFRIGIFTFKPAVYQHFYNWALDQDNSKNTRTKALLLPEFTTEIAFENSAKINLKYKTNARFASINNLAENFILTNFNSVFKGNAALENELYHSASARYSRYSLLRGIMTTASVNYNKKIEQFKRETQLQGIDQFSTLALFELPEESWGFVGRFSKKIKKIRTKIEGNHSINNFYQIVNNETNKNKSARTTATLGLETLFKKMPNLEVEYTKVVNNYASALNKNKFNTDNFTAYLDYVFWEDFILKGEYSYTAYNNGNNGTKNTFDNAMLSLFYQKEDSPWGFEVKASNLFDTKFKQDNSFGSFLISDTKTFILPRIVMLTISYKL